MGNTSELPNKSSEMEPKRRAQVVDNVEIAQQYKQDFRSGYFTGPPSPRARICQNIHQFGTCSLIFYSTDTFFQSLLVVFLNVDESVIHYHIVCPFFLESVAPKDILRHNAHAPRAPFYLRTIHLLRWKGLLGTHTENHMTTCFCFHFDRSDPSKDMIYKAKQAGHQICTLHGRAAYSHKANVTSSRSLPVLPKKVTKICRGQPRATGHSVPTKENS